MRIVSLLSGGLDSTVLAAELVAGGHEVEALSFDYGQRHRRELESARSVAKYLGIPQRVIPIALDVVAPTSSLTSPEIEVPLGHYADPTMRTTVVPNRNMVLLSLGIAAAIAGKAGAVAYAAHRGDHAVYPDCRPEFVSAMKAAAALCDYDVIEILAPYLAWSKTDIARRGAELRAPLELTYSCYKGSAVHCGQCGTCYERQEAFRDAGVQDPTEYACRAVPAA